MTGAVFTKGLSQVLGLSWLYFYTKVKPKTWLRPFVNTAPGLFPGITIKLHTFHGLEGVIPILRRQNFYNIINNYKLC